MAFEEAEGCSCHINPPCTYCTSHSICDKCGDNVLNEYINEDDDSFICDDCQTTVKTKDAENGTG
jgi:hypothetical protein